MEEVCRESGRDALQKAGQDPGPDAAADAVKNTVNDTARLAVEKVVPDFNLASFGDLVQRNFDSHNIWQKLQNIINVTVQETVRGNVHCIFSDIANDIVEGSIRESVWNTVQLENNKIRITDEKSFLKMSYENILQTLKQCTISNTDEKVCKMNQNAYNDANLLSSKMTGYQWIKKDQIAEEDETTKQISCDMDETNFENDDESEGRASFERLPPHVQTKILSNIAKDQLLPLCAVSKGFLNAIHDPCLWRRVLLEDLGGNFWKNVEKASECLENVPLIESIEFHTDNMRWLDPGFGNGSCMVLQGFYNIVDIHPEIKRLTIHATPAQDRFRYNVRILNHIAATISDLRNVEHLVFDFYGFKEQSISPPVFECFLHLSHLTTLHIFLDCFEDINFDLRIIPETRAVSEGSVHGILQLQHIRDLALLGMGWSLEEWTNFLEPEAALFKKLTNLHLGTFLHENVYIAVAKICCKTLTDLRLDDEYRRSDYFFGNELITNKALSALFRLCDQLRRLKIFPKVRPFSEEVPVGRFHFSTEEEAQFRAKLDEIHLKYMELDRTGYKTMTRRFSFLKSLTIIEEHRLCPIRIIVDPVDFPKLQHLHLEVLDHNARPRENQKAIVFRAAEQTTDSQLRTLTLIKCRIILKVAGLISRGDFLTKRCLERVFPQTLILVTEDDQQ